MHHGQLFRGSHFLRCVGCGNRIALNRCIMILLFHIFNVTNLEHYEINKSSSTSVFIQDVIDTNTHQYGILYLSTFPHRVNQGPKTSAIFITAAKRH